MPPGSAKSTYSSILFPPWLFCRSPRLAVIAASHTSELAENFGRRVRNTITQFGDVLGYGVASDNRAAGRWETTQGGEYFAAGVGGAITGRRADLAIIDDPVKSREAAESQTDRDKVWAWYKSDLYTRLKPDARIVLIMCMVGGTKVLMADGGERRLRDLRIGDEIATYEDGKLAVSLVENWKSHGDDDVLEIRTESGASTRANARHPFLIERNGSRKWVRVNGLRKGDAILRVLPVGAHGLALLARATDAAETRPLCGPPPNISDFTLDRVLSIVPCGREEVFDVQVSRTANFIADGFVSHNTRWHEDDLGGRLLAEAETGGDRWRVLKLPALANAADDPLGRAVDEPLWPEWEARDALARKRAVLGEREFGALFQQDPRPAGTSFFDEKNLLDDGQPVAPPTFCDAVFATMDTAVKTGTKNDGTAVCYWALNKRNGSPLTLLDWEIVQIEGSLLEAWLPTIFQNLEQHAKTCGARMGSLGVHVEDKASGTILLQQARRRGWQAHEIDSKLTSVGKDERAISISGYVHRGMIKMSPHSYAKNTTYKSRNGNHFLMQVFRFQIGVKDQADDLLDAFCYGVAIALGNTQGF